MRLFILPLRSTDIGFSQIARIWESSTNLKSENLILDFKNCNFFDANMAAPLMAVLVRIREKSIVIKFENLRNTIESILRKNLFLVGFGYESLTDVNETTLPFQCFGITDTQSFAKYLDVHLLGKGIPQMTEDLTKQFRKSIFEIFQNCATHSSSQRGVFVCGQFYPGLHSLNLTISDAGVGIRTNVRRHLQRSISSIDSIEWALQEGNTTKTGSQPGGFGLKLLQEFIELNEGKVQIASRLGYYEFKAGKRSFNKLTSDFRGTAINIEIKTNDNKSYALSSKVSVEDIF